jgi:hypothetical protein
MRDDMIPDERINRTMRDKGYDKFQSYEIRILQAGKCTLTGADGGKT